MPVLRVGTWSQMSTTFGAKTQVARVHKAHGVTVWAPGLPASPEQGWNVARAGGEDPETRCVVGWSMLAHWVRLLTGLSGGVISGSGGLGIGSSLRI